MDIDNYYVSPNYICHMKNIYFMQIIFVIYPYGFGQHHMIKMNSTYGFIIIIINMITVQTSI